MSYPKKEEILANILANISNEYEKSNGNLAYDIPSATAIELEEVNKTLQAIGEKVDVDKLSGEDLERFTKQRKGTKRKLATKATGTLLVTGNGTISVGDLFETVAGTQFKAIETVIISNTGNVKIEAVEAGAKGNVGANSITLMPVTIQGIVTVTNPNPTENGFEAESDASLRERYYEAIQAPSTSGNIYHYLKWSKEVVGVGAAKVFSLWNGDNTVKVTIIDSNKKPAGSSLVNDVQEYIDPKGEFIDGHWTTWGTGAGQAPIGAYCTIASATDLKININCDVEEKEGYTLAQVIANITANIEKYLADIAFKQDYVSYAMLGSIILNTDGVKDYTQLKINNTAANINIGAEEVATLGTINII